jgi:hypothetical protein
MKPTSINSKILEKALRYHASMEKPREYRDLLSFVKETFFALYNTEFIVTVHHKALCDLLTKCALRQLPDDTFIVVINIAPRFGKTLIVTLYVAWCYVMNGAAKFFYVSYSKDLSHKFSREVKDVLKNVCGLSSNMRKDSTGIWTTAQRGEFLATTIYGVATGFGAGDLTATPFGGDLIFDDPNKISDTFYETRRQGVADKLWNTFITRRNNMNKVPLIIFQQRVHPEDLSGAVLNQSDYKYVHLKIPALIDGESIFPQRISTETLLAMKSNDPYTFNAQMMQDPQAMNGGFFNLDTLKPMTRKHFDSIAHTARCYVRSWDLAGVGERRGQIAEDTLKRDWTRGVKFAVFKDFIVIVDMVGQRGLVDANDVLIDETSKADGWDCVPVFPLDPGVGGEHYGEMLKKLPGVQGKNPELLRQNGSKITRAQPLKAMMNRGKVYILQPTESEIVEGVEEWQEPLLKCMANFPFGKNDDATDALTLGCIFAYDKYYAADLGAIADFYSGKEVAKEDSVFGDTFTL